jgi:hypothetical protein
MHVISQRANSDRHKNQNNPMPGVKKKSKKATEVRGLAGVIDRIAQLLKRFLEEHTPALFRLKDGNNIRLGGGDVRIHAGSGRRADRGATASAEHGRIKIDSKSGRN